MEPMVNQQPYAHRGLVPAFSAAGCVIQKIPGGTTVPEVRLFSLPGAERGSHWHDSIPRVQLWGTGAGGIHQGAGPIFLAGCPAAGPSGPSCGLFTKN